MITVVDDLDASTRARAGEPTDVETTLQRPAEVDDPVLRRFVAGDPSALREIYDANSSLVYSMCARSLGANRAADATQDVFLAAWRSRDRYDPTRGSISGWLVGIARFKVIDILRADGRQPLSVDLTGDGDRAATIDLA